MKKFEDFCLIYAKIDGNLVCENPREEKLGGAKLKL